MVTKCLGTLKKPNHFPHSLNKNLNKEYDPGNFAEKKDPRKFGIKAQQAPKNLFEKPALRDCAYFLSDLKYVGQQAFKRSYQDNYLGKVQQYIKK